MSCRAMWAIISLVAGTSGCASGPFSYAPQLETPDAPPRTSSLENSNPLLTVECRGDLQAGGEVCVTRAGSSVVHGVRNVVVSPNEVIARFQDLVAATEAELGRPPVIASYIAARADTVVPFAGFNCQFEAIRTSMPMIPLDSPEATARAGEGRLCLHAKWTTPTEEVVVTLVPAVTSALDGPAVPERESEQLYGLRLYRGTVNEGTRAAYQRARLSAAEAIIK